MIQLHRGVALAVLATMPAESIDSIVTDPPYGRRPSPLMTRACLTCSPKPTEKVAEAYATTSAADLYVAYKLSAAAADAAKQALFTRRARLDSLRTLSANVRSLT